MFSQKKISKKCECFGRKMSKIGAVAEHGDEKINEQMQT
jgi:hypothetical protein